jgi:hypothetical protein
MIKTADIAWIAGIFEGEGTFRISGNSCPVMAVGMTDKDIIERVAIILNVRVTGPIRNRVVGGLSENPVWRATLCGMQAAGWMMTIFGHMGIRRQEKIAEVLERWKHRKGGRPRGYAPTCHPERKTYARGLCNACYFRMKKELIKAGRWPIERGRRNLNMDKTSQ